ncbi:MAG: serine/threonine protein kinase [Sandaracinaceae bacterium]|nr:serine/threonine protein kinase [Sandaracinaceae bacterium]MDW8246322.1 serine/threonine-protein kinase [Sandaracinaceae bacterium]
MILKKGAENQKSEGSPPYPLENEDNLFCESTQVLSETDIGAFFSNRFRVDGSLGQGFSGKLLTAFDTCSEKVVVLKILSAEQAKDQALLSRFVQEAEILRSFEHPAIVRFIDYGRTPQGSYWIATEHVEGETLKERLERKGTFGFEEAWPIVRTLCEAVDYAHARGIIHRDIKPENLILPRGGVPPCQLLDFGLSRYLYRPTRLTQKGMVVGTPRYIAPEALFDSTQASQASDVFSIAAIVFEMLSGRSIYPAEDVKQLLGCILSGRILSLRSLRPDAPPSLEAALTRALARDPKERTPTVRQFLSELEIAMRDVKTHQSQSTPKSPAETPITKKAETSENLTTSKDHPSPSPQLLFTRPSPLQYLRSHWSFWIAKQQGLGWLWLLLLLPILALLFLVIQHFF